MRGVPEVAPPLRTDTLPHTGTSPHSQSLLQTSLVFKCKVGMAKFKLKNVEEAARLSAETWRTNATYRSQWQAGNRARGHPYRQATGAGATIIGRQQGQGPPLSAGGRGRGHHYRQAAGAGATIIGRQQGQGPPLSAGNRGRGHHYRQATGPGATIIGRQQGQGPPLSEGSRGRFQSA